MIPTDKEHFESHDKFVARIGAAMVTNAAFAQAANAIGESGANPRLIDFASHVLADLPNGMEVFQALGRKPALLLAMERMSPAHAGNILTEISNQLGGNRQVEKSATNGHAPAPITPVKRSAPTSTGLSDDLSPEEWIRRRNAQISAQQRRR